MQIKDIIEITIMNPDESNKIRDQFKCRVIEVNTSHFRAEPLNIVDHRFDRDWFPIDGSRLVKVLNTSTVRESFQKWTGLDILKFQVALGLGLIAPLY